ncbi:hypothetical protein PV328_009417 [Microctonus aethiopoides]|uniref:F-box domain-containing protein n=1 Tax=Microctonus aethiopoides TaxID=144406 RepID=A0AA39C5R0_9HYME|nr:hypothetical protein PV328_009417 [Microctonus aethiopoides]
MPPKELQSRKQQNKSIKVNSDESLSFPTINILDNDCLIKIFLYLPIKDRMRIERVCKRWQTVNQQAWSDIKELKIPEALNFIESYSVKIDTTERAVEKLLLRCGRFLNKLEFETYFTFRRLVIMPLIAKHCHNLQCLILYLKNHSNSDMTLLFLNLHKLERLKLSVLNRNDFRDVCLKKLTTNSMPELSLSSNSYVFPGTYCGRINGGGAIGIQNMKNLWNLRFYQFYFEADELKLIVCNESITYLSLENCYFYKCINLIANLRGLKYLNLSKVRDVNDSFLIKLAANYSTPVTNDGINAVSKLKKLTTLMISHSYKVTDSALSKFVALKVLQCRYCKLVRDFGAIELLQNAPHLEEIDLSSTSVSTRFLNAACNVAISRANAMPLKIIVSWRLKLIWSRPRCISKSVLIVEWEERDDKDPYYFFDDDDDDDYDG